MLSLATSPLAPVLGQRVPLRGPARLLFNSYARTRYHAQKSVTRVTTTTGDVFDADLSSTLEWQLWAFGHYEKHFAELFGCLVGPGDRCVDVGANVGVHTVRLARLVGADGEVIAIEPDPHLVQRTSRNIALNGVANVRLINAAASERAGVTTVSVVTVDDVCAGKAVSLIKIHVVGHEAAVVRGAANTIARCAPSIVFGYAAAMLEDAVAQTPFGWLADCGYQMFRVRAARHGITGRVRLALDRQRETPAAGGDFLAVSPQAAMQLRLVLV